MVREGQSRLGLSFAGRHRAMFKFDRGRNVDALEAMVIHLVVGEEHWEGIRGLHLGGVRTSVGF